MFAATEKNILLGLVVLVGLVAIVSGAEKDGNNESRLKLLRRGIILKCHGNPVSCYGKRSSSANEEAHAVANNEASADGGDDDFEGANEEKQEMALERQLETLIRRCQNDDKRSCSTILKIMLMNSN